MDTTNLTTLPDGSKALNKTVMAIQMVQAGIDPKDALRMVNLKDKVSAKAVSELRQKVKKQSLTAPSLVSAAQNQVKRILKATPREEAHEKVNKAGEVVKWTDRIYPTDSNILAAASMVYDRYEPVKGSEPDQGQRNTYIDLSSYRVQVNVNQESIEKQGLELDGKGK